jgi:hypothetical protein
LQVVRSALSFLDWSAVPFPEAVGVFLGQRESSYR